MRGLFALVVLLGSCRHAPQGISAGDVCYKLEAAGVATKCQVGSKGDLGIATRAASEYVTFDVPASPGVSGQVLRFRNAADYAEALSTLDQLASIVGPHRYGSAETLMYVQLSKRATAEAGAKAAGVVSALAPPKLDR